MHHTASEIVESDIEAAPAGERPVPTLTAVHELGVSRAISSSRAKWQTAKREVAQILGLSTSWLDRLSLAGFLAKLYLTRLLPLQGYDWDTSVRIQGVDYVVGLRTSEIYVIEEVFKYQMYDRLAHFVPNQDWIVFDVGANIGIVSMLQARRGARVYAFEPNPACYRRLVKNIRANGLEDRIVPFNVALGDDVKTGAMRVVRGGTTGGIFVTGDGQAGDMSLPVNMTTLDRVLPEDLPQIDLLKIDVEGAEIDVLRGARAVLRVTKRVVIEFHSRALLSEAKALLAQSGFVSELDVKYYSEDAASGQEEVGLLYAARP